MHNNINAGVAASLAAEFNQEASATRRLLERVPEDKLTWRPHPKSMSLGELALHLAQLQGGIAEFISTSEAEVPTVPLPEATSVQEILDAHDSGVSVVAAKLVDWGDDDLVQEVRMMAGGEVLMAMPRVAWVRSLMMNHSYHHRGQLTVYLRLLDVPLPSIYGPTADEA